MPLIPSPGPNLAKQQKQFPTCLLSSYTITVTDKEGSSTSKTFEVTEPAPLQISPSTTTEVSCHGASDGSITAGTVSGGTAPFEYFLNGDFSSTNTFSGLTEGTYTLTVKDANACEISQEIIVSQPEALTMAAPSFTAISCNGGNDGTVTAGTVSGGTGSYQYKLNDGTFGSTNSFSNLSAGNYILTVRDQNECETSQEVTVTQPDALSMTAPSYTAVSCNGGNDGTVTAGTVSGGTGFYQYKINDSTFGSENSFPDLSAGNYIITVRDQNECETSQEVTVTQPDALILAAPTSTGVSCNGASDGTVTACCIWWNRNLPI
ncbi:SprB repeat-containing protein [Antarcticibacterium sp. 1MA-6-2]|uniref:SprB repeat-containing protein n=1 Tax=Antarcticibacterium sp. 1MA-6-2 TaxID=2908210 RepID=UPI0038FCCB26